MIRVKICGITRPLDAREAVRAGADALGFVFAESPRRVSPEEARAIVAALPPFVAAVGVFVDERPGRVRDIAASCGLDYVQFHGGEPPEECAAFGRKAIKAVRVGSARDL
ncbi:MAG: N-(5'-phosphoribosyl)anthranilate isomerase, partial [bacterium]|nr:N-(5'-phosphoribosyl)anthranilate isomerase [bacterium]